jgi:hypothetical protein
MSSELPISVSTRRMSPVTATAGQTQFAFNFPLIRAEDIRVLRTRSGIQTEITIGPDFSVSGVGQAAGGTVTLTAGSLAGDVIVIEGDAGLDRLTGVTLAGRFSSTLIDQEFDLSLIRDQELRRDVSKAQQDLNDLVASPKMWLTGSSNPTSGTGEKGDIYLNVISGEVFQKTSDTVWVSVGSIKGPQGNAGPQGSTGLPGIPGPSGSRWFSGAGAPADVLGQSGDFYLNTVNGDVYEKSLASTWALLDNFMGPPGPGTGDVLGPASATTNAIARYASGTGKVLKNSSVFVNDAGNVGVGTSAPLATLDVQGDILYASNGFLGSNLYFDYAQGRWEYRTNGFGAAIKLSESGSGAMQFLTAPSNASGNNAAASPAIRMYLTNAGNLGLGTVTPTNKLHIVGPDNISNTLIAGVSKALRITPRPTDIILEATDETGGVSFQPMSFSGTQFVFNIAGSGGVVGINSLGLDVYGKYYQGGRLLMPWINVQTDHGAVGDNATDNTAAFNGAIAEANATGRSIVIPPGTYRVGNLNAITRSGVRVFGFGRNSTILAANVATGDTLTMLGQFQSVEDLSLMPAVFRTSGYEVAIKEGCFQNIVRNVFISFGHNGIYNMDASESIIENVHCRYMTGTLGLYYTGTAGKGSYGMRIKNILADNPYPLMVFNPLLRGNFTPSAAYGASVTGAISGTTLTVSAVAGGTVRIGQTITGTGIAPRTYVTGFGTGSGGVGTYSVNISQTASSTALSCAGDVFIANNWVWQVTAPGTAGASGPAAPSTPNWYTTSVANGTMQCRAICNSSLLWIGMDNYANSMTILGGALINGAGGFRMMNSSGIPGARPLWALTYDLEIDHPYFVGVDLQGGAGFLMQTGWIGSTYVGNGIQIASTYLGEVSIEGSRIVANAQHGILVNGGIDVKIVNNFLCNNGVSGPAGAFHGCAVANNQQRFSIQNNTTGLDVFGASTFQGYGISVGAGCDHFIVTGNIGRGNATASIINASGTALTRVVANNV